MFDENFSFDTPRSPSIGSSSTATRDTSRSVSPCSAASPFPPPRFSVTDLAAQFADQRIHKQSRICYDSCESYANLDNDEDWSIPSAENDDYSTLSRSRTFPQRAHSPSRRTQRQVNSRMLCNVSHHRDIAALVARMVDSKEQCSVSRSDSFVPVAADEDEDEGYNSFEDSEMAGTSRRSSLAALATRHDVRRASNTSRTGACVSKAIRLRKDNHHKRIRSSEKSNR